MSTRPVSLGLCLLLASCGGAGASSAPAGDPSVTKQCRDELGIKDGKDCVAVSGLVLPETLPPARGNAVGDSLPAAQLGFQIFFDQRFSTATDERCATCHVPEKSFHDGLQVSLGIDSKPLPRNSPSVFTAAWYPDQFWDGRADSLWSQPLFPLESPVEMASSRLAISHVIADNQIYRDLYAAAFGETPDLSDMKRFPSSGKPGAPEFDDMSAADQDVVNRMFANVGKSLEAYMRKVATGRSALDLYLLGDNTALDSSAREGLATFVSARCIDCHNGPTLSDGKYYDMHVPALEGSEPDHGRAAGLAILKNSIFNAHGPYFDAGDEPIPALPKARSEDEGAFRTPSLRDIAKTAPYGHNGYYPTLQDLLANHGPTKLTEAQTSSIIVFLLQMTGSYPERPWSNWPTN
jgi:cytochrome c peroxidase